MDWRFPGYFEPKKLADNAALMKRQGYGQVEELMSRYGRIDIVWHDGGWHAHEGADADAAWFWEPVKLNQLVRKHQPKAVISPHSGWEGDFQRDEIRFSFKVRHGCYGGGIRASRTGLPTCSASIVRAAALPRAEQSHSRGICELDCQSSPACARGFR